ncbi:MAG: hypothetical protein CVV51_09225 [Spirochaetae bacterium HGW-Spirochaetae-7]|jgi:hypothetical protein|nr:MAG: hypothetical protein CVV51_09225 [Spirochaetae bacterium HGW-Spirochaetae-7]
MVLMRLVYVVAVLGLALVGGVGASVWAYLVGMDAGLKGGAESVLFFGLILAGLEAFGLFLLVVGSRRKGKELETLTDLVRHGGTIADSRLESFGFLGVQLRSILHELSDASERKSVRIASLTGLLRAVMDLVERPLLVIGLDGNIVAASKGVTGNEAFAEMKAGESKIGEFIHDVDLRAILGEADRAHAPVEREGHMTFIPVFSVQGEITHFLIDMSKKGAIDRIASIIQGKKPARKPGDGSAGDKPRGSGFISALRARFGRPKAKDAPET